MTADVYPNEPYWDTPRGQEYLGLIDKVITHHKQNKIDADEFISLMRQIRKNFSRLNCFICTDPKCPGDYSHYEIPFENEERLAMEEVYVH